MAPAHLFQSTLAHSDLERFYREVRHTSEHTRSTRLNMGFDRED